MDISILGLQEGGLDLVSRVPLTAISIAVGHSALRGIYNSNNLNHTAAPARSNIYTYEPNGRTAEKQHTRQPRRRFHH